MPEASFPVEVIGGMAVVAAPEEIDAANAAGLRAALLRAAAHRKGTLVVDMSRTQFCDSSGLNVLVCAHRRAQTEGGEVVLVISAAAVLRILALTGIDCVIPQFTSLDEALTQTPGPAPRPPVPAS